MSSDILYPSQLTGPEALKELVKCSLELMPLDVEGYGGHRRDLEDMAYEQAELIERLQLLAQAVQLEILDKTP